MTSTPGVSAGPALIAAYLADLERALLGADPGERADTIEAIREHIADQLGGTTHPDIVDVRKVLDDLGPVERIAGAASPAAAHPEPVNDGWAGPVALGLAGLSAIFLIVNFFIALALAVVVIFFVVITLTAKRRATGHAPGALKAAAVVSAIVAVIALTAAVTLVAAGTSDTPVEGPVVSVQP